MPRDRNPISKLASYVNVKSNSFVWLDLGWFLIILVSAEDVEINLKILVGNVDDEISSK